MAHPYTTDYESGMTIKHVALKHGVSTYKVYTTLLRDGAAMRQRGCCACTDPRILKRDATIIEMREHGLSYKSIGDRIGLTRQAVAIIIKKKAPHLLGRMNKRKGECK